MSKSDDRPRKLASVTRWLVPIAIGIGSIAPVVSRSHFFPFLVYDMYSSRPNLDGPYLLPLATLDDGTEVLLSDRRLLAPMELAYTDRKIREMTDEARTELLATWAKRRPSIKSIRLVDVKRPFDDRGLVLPSRTRPF